MNDDTARMPDRIEASKLLADRAFGKAPAVVHVESDDEHRVPELEVERRPTKERMIELARLAIRYELPLAEQPVIDVESDGDAVRWPGHFGRAEPRPHRRGAFERTARSKNVSVGDEGAS
jgi:hypothetical protein